MNKICVLIVFLGAATAQYDSNHGHQYGGGSDGYSRSAGGATSYTSLNRGLSQGGYASNREYSTSAFGNRGIQNGAGYRSGYSGVGGGAYSTTGGYGAGSQTGGYGAGSQTGGYGSGLRKGNVGDIGYGKGDESLSEPARYEFRYDVLVPEDSLEFGHQEQRDGDDTTGSYYVLLPDGRRQLVEYTADEEGYKPRISYTDVAENSEAGNNGNGAGSYANGAGSYANGAGSYANGAGSYANGAGSYTNGAGSYANGAGSYANGAGNYANGAGSYANGAGNGVRYGYGNTASSGSYTNYRRTSGPDGQARGGSYERNNASNSYKSRSSQYRK